MYMKEVVVVVVVVVVLLVALGREGLMYEKYVSMVCSC